MSLSRRLRTLRPEALSAGGQEPAGPGLDDQVDALLQRRLGEARARWPAVRFTEEQLLAGLARHPPPSLDDLAALRCDELLLARACLDRDPQALAVLEAEVLSLVPRWLARLEGAAADDVRQELRQRLLLGDDPLAARFEGRRPLQAWLRVVATRLAIDLHRARKPPGDADALEELWSAPDPELDAVKLLDLSALRGLIHDALGALPARERSLLRLHYLEGLSLERLAVIERVHRATVARRLAEARAAVLERVRRLLSERFQLSSEDGDSLLRFVRSRLDLSFSRALGRASS
jgi:RNA polymerase sigma-70 factor (ECF subfamily)